MAAPDLRPLPVAHAPLRRLSQLFAGLALYGTSMAMQIRGGLGLNPWDVLHQGLATRLPISFGAITAVTGVVVLLLWIPLRQRPGIGTVANVVVIAFAVDAALALLPAPTGLVPRVAMMAGGIVLNGVASAAYVGARLGPGPRDGLMTGFAARTGRSIRLVRTAIEIVVLGTGWLLGGTVGVGTVLYALAIGPLTQLFLPLFVVREPEPVRTA
ncbi:membrane protein YczE [Pseudonocardia sp. T1-2H]|uniref:membrane protein YczE n=1 Tax=Pseudonocardia sp. T1-2H TaxID=3128899 RepID=UPI0031013DAB